MINFEDINKAQEKINEIFELRDELIKASPYLNDMRANLIWYQKVYNTIPEQQERILSLIEDPVKSTLSINQSSFDFGVVTEATGSYFAASGDTRIVIQSYGSQHYSLIDEYDEIINTDVLIDRIDDKLALFRKNLIEFDPRGVLREARNSYANWKTGIVSNSDLAKDIRSFQDILNGALHRARVDTYPATARGNPDPSWNKMADALAKSGGTSLKTLRDQQGVEKRLHLAFTEIMKKTRDVDTKEMDRIFKDYIEHVYAILNLMDENCFV